MGTKERYAEHKGRQLKVAVPTPEHLTKLRYDHINRLGKRPIPVDAEYYADRVLSEINDLKKGTNCPKSRKNRLYPLTND